MEVAFRVAFVKIVNERNDIVLADRVVLADNFLLRLKGLLGKRGLEAGEGLLLYPCNSIHCFGMKFRIDVLFLDREKRVLAIHHQLEPGQRARAKGAHYVLEVGGGSIAQDAVSIGDTVRLLARE